MTLLGRMRRTRCKTWDCRPVLGAHAFSYTLPGSPYLEVGVLVDADDDKPAGNLRQDVWTESFQDVVIYCLCLDTQPEFGSEIRCGIGLALCLTGKGSEEYSRIGLAYNMPLAWFETSPETLLTVV